MFKIGFDKRTLYFLTFVLFFIILAAGFVLAYKTVFGDTGDGCNGECYRFESGSCIYYATVFGDPVCDSSCSENGDATYYVCNYGSGVTYMVPAKTQTDWDSFMNHQPNGVSDSVYCSCNAK